MEFVEPRFLKKAFVQQASVMLSSCQHIIVVQQKTEAWRQQQRTLYVFFQHSPDLKSYNRAMCLCVCVCVCVCVSVCV